MGEEQPEEENEERQGEPNRSVLLGSQASRDWVPIARAKRRKEREGVGEERGITNGGGRPILALTSSTVAQEQHRHTMRDQRFEGDGVGRVRRVVEDSRGQVTLFGGQTRMWTTTNRNGGLNLIGRAISPSVMENAGSIS